MKKLIFLFIFLGLITLVSLSVEAERYEGEIIKIDSNNNQLVLRKDSGVERVFSVADGADLYYNNARADLGMYSPVTEDDFVSGYIETDGNGRIKEAKFFYLVREGKIVEMDNNKMVIKETESGIRDSYYISDQINVYLNNSPVQLKNIDRGMKVLVVLNHNYKIKKVAAFHYNYTGLIQEVDFGNEKVVVNVGSRLEPNLKTFKLGGQLQGDCTSWDELANLLKEKSFVLGKILMDESQQNIAFIKLRSF